MTRLAAWRLGGYVMQMPRVERSAGFIIFHLPRAGDFTSAEFLLLDYGRHWDFAKGHVEKGETDLQAALRELEEETGIVGVKPVPGFAQEITYYFRHKRRGLIRKTVIFYLAATPDRSVKLSDEHCGFAFLPLDPAVKQLTYSTARQVLRAAGEFIKAMSER